MRYPLIFLFLGLLTSLLVACSGIRQTSLPQEGSQVASTKVSSPTFSPSRTPKPKVTATASITPIPTSSRTALPIEMAESSLPSPDKKWTAYFFGDYKAQLKVANVEKTTVWEVNEGNFGGSEAFFQPYRWSQDSRYLYFNTHVSIDGYVPFYDGVGLRRLDVSNGKVSEILPDGDVVNGKINIVQFSLSPNDDLLAYIDRVAGEPELVIRDLETSSESSLLLTGVTAAGSILWSPEEDRLVLALAKGDDWENTLFTVMEVNLSTLETAIIIENNKFGLDPIEWIAENEIKIQERGESQNIIFADLATGEIRVITSTN